ncbi:MAG: nitrilase-related carbon-nitrogen hydrolase, partial [Actinomycetota bacterium]
VPAINTNPRDVTLRHLAATALLQPNDDLDLVLWPENTVDVTDFTTSAVREDIAAEARRLGAPIAVGVTEDAGNNFTNAQIVVDEAGTEISRYDKVRRVPYGEYIPLRAMLDAFGAPVNRILRPQHEIKIIVGLQQRGGGQMPQRHIAWIRIDGQHSLRPTTLHHRDADRLTRIATMRNELRDCLCCYEHGE